MHLRQVVALTGLFVALFAGVAAAETCVTDSCHAKLKTLKNLHQPVKDGDCLSCHTRKAAEHPARGGKSFELTAKGSDLCFQCHDRNTQKRFVHAPLKEGECLTCHRAHGGNGKKLLDVGDDQTELCVTCHDAAAFKQKYMHGPAAVGECTRCHDPHAANEKGLLKKSPREVCLACHADFAESMARAVFTHPPVANDPCTVCHNAHGSNALHVLNKKMPELCTDCHQRIGQKMSAVKVGHKPLSEAESCANCHTAHTSSTNSLLPVEEKDLCLGCHGKDGLGKPPLRNIRKELDGKKYTHGPIGKGRCASCHDPHGSDYFRMLPGTYTPAFYQSYTADAYGACLACHNKNMLKSADTTTDTNFRNGRQNLHYLHVSNTSKGRTCRACHDVHGSNGLKLLSNDGASFGEWKVPVRFVPSPKGGTCSPGCHRTLRYDREKPEDYRKK